MIIYSRALSNDELDAVENYLRNKYDIKERNEDPFINTINENMGNLKAA